MRWLPALGEECRGCGCGLHKAVKEAVATCRWVKARGANILLCCFVFFQANGEIQRLNVLHARARYHKSSTVRKVLRGRACPSLSSSKSPTVPHQAVNRLSIKMHFHYMYM